MCASMGLPKTHRSDCGIRRTIVDNKDDGLYKSVDFNHCLDDDDGLRDHLDVLCLDG